MKAVVAGALVVAAVLAAMPASMADNGPAADPIARAREAAETVTYSGQLQVRWVDHAGVTHSTELPVEGGDGVMRVGDGGSLLAATSQQRWLFRHGEWDLVSPSTLASAPPAERKYQVTTVPAAEVAGRPTTAVILATNGRIRERLYLDAETGLLLRREQLDANGDLVRTVEFESISLAADTPPAKPAASVDRRPASISSAPAPYKAPSQLAGGYQRTAVLRRNGAVQVVYSDGVHTLSVFEQRGRLDRKSLPDGAQTVAVGSAQGVRMSWAGGEVVLWDAGQSTFTAVGDGDGNDVLTAARSMPHPGHLTTWQRMRRACASIVDAVAA